MIIWSKLTLLHPEEHKTQSKNNSAFWRNCGHKTFLGVFSKHSQDSILRPCSGNRGGEGHVSFLLECFPISRCLCSLSSWILVGYVRLSYPLRHNSFRSHFGGPGVKPRSWHMIGKQSTTELRRSSALKFHSMIINHRPVIHSYVCFI